MHISPTLHNVGMSKHAGLGLCSNREYTQPLRNNTRVVPMRVTGHVSSVVQALFAAAAKKNFNFQTNSTSLLSPHRFLNPLASGCLSVRRNSTNSAAPRKSKLPENWGTKKKSVIEEFKSKKKNKDVIYIMADNAEEILAPLRASVKEQV